jgi:hypothetical protein
VVEARAVPSEEPLPLAAIKARYASV